MLYVNPSFGRYVEEEHGRPDPASDALLKTLYEQANHPEYQCFFRYEEGDMVFWDNRSCMHRATVDFSPHERTMRRVTIQGREPPFFDPSAVATKRGHPSKL
jgi:taurine dioxygenase